MIIVGIDPGISRCGFGVITKEQGKVTVRDYGCFETDPKQTMPERLLIIGNLVDALLKKHNPQAVVVEEIFFSTNAKTAFVVGQARGVVLMIAAKNKIPVFSYTPMQVKVAVGGWGNAQKAQIGKMVQVLLKLSSIPKPDDTTDALAIALTHAFSAKK